MPKGIKGFQKGYKPSKEHIEKLAKFKRGKKDSYETRLKKSKAKKKEWSAGKRKFNPNSGFQKGHSQTNTGRTYWKKGQHISPLTEFKKGMEISKETRENMSKARKREWDLGLRKKPQSGEKSLNWQGGISFEPYGTDFNRPLKEQIRKRDNYRCQECFRHQDELYTKNGRKYKLIIHHIDYNKQNNQEDNLISLCRNCHLQTNFKRKNWIKYFQNKLITINI